MSIYNYLFKFIIVGDRTVGKGALQLQFTDSRFHNEHDPTISLEVGSKTLKINGEQIKILIWDTAGEETSKSITQSQYRGSIGGIIVYDVTNRQSFENLRKWYNEIKGYVSDRIEVVIVGNKIDLKESRVVTSEEGLKFAKKYGFEYFETSAKTGENVDAVFESMASNLLSKIDNGDIDPTKEVYGIKIGSIGVKQKTKKLTNNGNSLQSLNKYHELEAPLKNGRCC